ncbi:glycoside hydrolase family 2 TIM barrel-domain containing protein [Elusimicrobiota bacterium]
MLSRKLLFLSVLFFAGNFSYLSAESFPLFDKGTEKIVKYGEYGEFTNVGKPNYKYVIKNKAALRQAVGEGIYPNVKSVLRDPAYKKANKEGKLSGNIWDYINTDNHGLNFYKWATSAQEPGTKLYYTALALERGGNIAHAIKAYYATVVHWPKSTGSTYWGTVWYIAPVSIDRIRYLTKKYPNLGMKLVGCSIRVKNGFDNDKNNDEFIIHPGKMIEATPEDFVQKREPIEKMKVLETVGEGKVKLKKYENRHWQLFVSGVPYIIRGMAYSPNKVGLSPDNGTLNVSRDWQFADYNNNGIIDAPFESYLDRNGNNKRDNDEKIVGDFTLMKNMGVNTLRLYHHPDFNKELLRKGYEDYGFMYLMGDFIGMYTAGSNADWYYGTDYTNPEDIDNMLESVSKMVKDYRNEPYILMWVLGNENNYGGPGEPGVSAGSGCRAKIQPEAYYKFVNKAVKLIKALDSQKRPVAVCNGDTLYLDICAKNAPKLDVFGANCYRGEQGFGSLWWDVKDIYDKPVLITEYGCSAHHSRWPKKRSDNAQARYHIGNWLDLESNFAGFGEGNALGGIVFEWTDEWWKAGPPPQFSPIEQDKVGKFGAPFLDGWSYEEVLGITTQGDGTDSPFLRTLRPAFFAYESLWRKYKSK